MKIRNSYFALELQDILSLQKLLLVAIAINLVFWTIGDPLKLTGGAVFVVYAALVVIAQAGVWHLLWRLLIGFPLHTLVKSVDINRKSMVAYWAAAFVVTALLVGSLILPQESPSIVLLMSGMAVGLSWHKHTLAFNLLSKD